VNHYTARSFWSNFNELPADVQRLARENHELLVSNPRHPSLQLKRVGPYWSVRVGANYRALGDPTDDGIVWFWIGGHDEYMRLVYRH